MWLLTLLLCSTVGAIGDRGPADADQNLALCAARPRHSCRSWDQKLDPALHSLLDALDDLQGSSCFANEVCAADKLLKSLDLSKKYTVFAVSTWPGSSPNPTPTPGRTVARGNGNTNNEAALALHFWKRGDSPPDLRTQEVTLQTSLTDPEYVNLGPNVPANIVSRPDRESGRKNVTLTSGLGKSVSVQLIDKEYVSGSIQVARSFLTLPKPFDQTLLETGGKRFHDALKNASLLGGASTTPGVTAFVPTDAAFNGVSVDQSVLRQHLLYGVLAYTPELKDAARFRTENGSALVVSAQNAAYSVNGARIVTPNVITKNGVIHYVDKFFTFNELAAASTGTGSNQNRDKKSGAVGHDSLFGPMSGFLVGAIHAVFAA
ncbi:hypothetical protein MAPG_09105 [Magnaporthiopsis poae ATCC 64411]|uniref:FAS1 domain-containing protein n=1 Tax=Magnaporthiopsis poae (strain ATCC 64411 / 73-15) TaxID=644358 RepID=A0A0C4E928_MAGP6|nr:hypothetical protein MAPG_09105 [Magnaporthiopsis poae ATCC 64411]